MLYFSPAQRISLHWAYQGASADGQGRQDIQAIQICFFQYFNQLYDLGIPLWNPASISSSDTWSCAITRLTILIQIYQAMSIQQWAKVARFQHVSTAEGQSPHAAAVRQQFRHPLWQGVSKDKRSKLSCCKATLAKSDSCRVIVLEAWTEETVNYCTVYDIHVFLFLVECYLWLLLLTRCCVVSMALRSLYNRQGIIILESAAMSPMSLEQLFGRCFIDCITR